MPFELGQAVAPPLGPPPLLQGKSDSSLEPRYILFPGLRNPLVRPHFPLSSQPLPKAGAQQGILPGPGCQACGLGSFLPLRWCPGGPHILTAGLSHCQLHTLFNRSFPSKKPSVRLCSSIKSLSESFPIKWGVQTVGQIKILKQVVCV